MGTEVRKLLLGQRCDWSCKISLSTAFFCFLQSQSQPCPVIQCISVQSVFRFPRKFRACRTEIFKQEENNDLLWNELKFLDLMFFQILFLYFTVLINGDTPDTLWIRTVFLSVKIPSFISSYIWEDFTQLSCSYLSCAGFWIDLRIALKPKNSLPKQL